MQLYLPKKWDGTDESAYDSQQEQAQYARLREEAGIPDDIAYQPKHAIATDLVEETRNSVDHACVIADSGFGRYKAFRKRLREISEPYVVEVRPSKTAVIPEDAPVESESPSPGSGPARTPPTVPKEIDLDRIDEIANDVDDAEAWEVIEWGKGSKEPLSGKFYRERVRAVTDQQDREVEDATGWLLIQKEQPAEKDSSLKAWLCWDLDDASLEQLVSWAHLRWTIEQYHDNIKQVLGADDFQGRTWDGFHHHLTVVMLTQAFVAEQRLQTGTDGCDLDTFEEVARRLVREAAIQRLMENHDFERQTAETVAVDMLRGFSEWG
jgi:SRSO17 transposase